MKAGIYIRVSSEEQRKKMGPAVQRRACRALCESHDWQIAESFEDLGISGRTKERPGLQAMLQAAAEGRIGAVCVYRLDRLARSVRYIYEIYQDGLQAHGVELASCKESVDTSGPMGRAMMGMVAVFAQMESEVIEERTTEGRLEKARQGRFSQAVRAFGFEWDKARKCPVIVEAEAQVVRDIFAMGAAHHSVEAICGKLNLEGVPRRGATRKGQVVPPGRWWNTDVKKILRNPAYMGRWVTHVDEQGNETEALADLRPSAIVDADTWAAAQASMQAYRLHRRPAVKRPYLLSGFLVCGHCGHALSVQSPSEGYRFYACCTAARSKHRKCPALYVRAAELEAAVWAKVKRWREDPELAREAARQNTEKLLPRYRRELVRVGVAMKDWQRRERGARAALENSIGNGGAYDLEAYGKTKADHDAHMSDLSAEAATLEARIAAVEDEGSKADWTHRALQAAGDLDTLDLPAKRRLLSALGVLVTVTQEIEPPAEGHSKPRLVAVHPRVEAFASDLGALAPARDFSRRGMIGRRRGSAVCSAARARVHLGELSVP